MKTGYNFSEILRSIDIAARVLNGEKFSKGDAAFEYGIGEITINRDLQWLRSMGLDVYTRKTIIHISDINSDVFPKLAEMFLSLQNHTDISKAVQSLHHQKGTSFRLILISKAISENRKLKIEYNRFEDEKVVHYIVKPFELKLNGLNWILRAVKEGEEIIKYFYVSRINCLHVLDEKFEQESGEEKVVTSLIKFRFSPEVKSQVIDKIWFDNFECKEDEDGYLILSTQQPLTNTLAGWCLSWWDKIEIIEPIELKDKILKMVNAFLQRNAL